MSRPSLPDSEDFSLERVKCQYNCGYAPKLVSSVSKWNLLYHEKNVCPFRLGSPLRSDCTTQCFYDPKTREWIHNHMPADCTEVANDPPILAESGETGSVRTFETGATRDQDSDKLEYEGFFSPLVLKRVAEYMHDHRFQSDGTLRAPDNWQKGMPLDSYMGSGWRHFMDWWLNHRGYEAGEEMEVALCALIFNASGYLHELLKEHLGQRATPTPG